MSELSSHVDGWRAEWLDFRRQAAVRGPGWLVLQLAISLIALWLVWIIGKGVWQWIILSAEWGVVRANLRLFAVGTYASDAVEEVWRPAASLAVVAVLLGMGGATWGGLVRGLARMLAAALALLLLLPAFAPVLTPLTGPSLATLFGAFAGGMKPLAIALSAQGLGWIAGIIACRVLPVGSTGRQRYLRLLRGLWLLSLPVVLLLLHGRLDLPPIDLRDWGGPLLRPAVLTGLPPVPLRDWGGLLLTLLLATVALALAFPLGIALALGRRSSLPLVRVVSVLYIELIRGVPLVTVLYMATLMVPLVLPQGVRPEYMLRALAGFTLFIAAYIAEDVRGGLAALGRGQYEAARAIGLGTADTYRLVILPQAIRIVIPALVGQFISLFKDTSLVVIIGLRELLGIAQVAVNQEEWLGLFREALVFIAVIYFLFSYAMSRTSRQLETR